MRASTLLNAVLELPGVRVGKAAVVGGEVRVTVRLRRRRLGCRGAAFRRGTATTRVMSTRRGGIWTWLAGFAGSSCGAGGFAARSTACGPVSMTASMSLYASGFPRRDPAARCRAQDLLRSGITTSTYQRPGGVYWRSLDPSHAVNYIFTIQPSGRACPHGRPPDAVGRGERPSRHQRSRKPGTGSTTARVIRIRLWSAPGCVSRPARLVRERPPRR